MADDGNDKPSSAREQNPSGGKDVLFGWLVGRAAADLGLAEAIAASEAQRAEQIRRLEETLLAQIQELQRQRSSEVPAIIPPAEIDDLRGQIQSVTLRLGLLEESRREADQAGNFSKTEIVALTNRIAEQRAHFELLAAECSAKLYELQQQLAARPPSSEIFEREIIGLQSALHDFSERLTRVESAATPTAAAERDDERTRWMAEIDERTTARIRDLGDEIREKLKAIVGMKADFDADKVETIALGDRIADVERAARQATEEIWADLSAQRAAMSADQQRRQGQEDAVKALDDKWNKRLGDLEAAVRKQLQGCDARRGDVAAVQAQVLSLSQRVADLAGRGDKEAVDIAAQAQWARDHEQSVEARLSTFAERLNEQRRAGESRGAEMASLRLELSGLAERTGKVEFAAQEALAAASTEVRRSDQAVNRLAAEITTLKNEVAERLQNLKTPQSLMQDLEKTIGLKLQDLQRQLGESQKQGEVRDERLGEIGRLMQALSGRLAAAESVSQRTQALIVNESEQSAQIRHSIRAEIDSLQAQLAGSPWSDTAVQAIEEKLNLRIRELESQLGTKMRQQDYRDAEFRELKTQVQSLSQEIVRPIAPVPLSPSPAVQPTPPSIVIPMDINALRARREEIFSLGTQVSESATARAPSELQGDALPSGADREQMRQLQERISADIERARAELREKSGRSKARR